ncbi:MULTISPECIES: fluoride efflux transporter FluC [Novipirellula]|uniref:Fluoride-specific ion channel FluC n=1 Tax=Novipirellula rosea TaxID=1031540 RepID=A0ABP8NKE5_9BACT
MSSWLNLAVVAVGGAVGSIARYGITLAMTSIPGGSSMIGTTVANVAGCAAMGALAEYSLLNDHFPPRLLLGLRVGFLGALTTFSTFAAESMLLAGEQRWPAAVFYVAANLFLGWAALFLMANLVKGWLA